MRTGGSTILYQDFEIIEHNRYQKLADFFSLGTESVKIDQADETGKRSNEIEFDTSSFQTSPVL